MNDARREAFSRCPETCKPAATHYGRCPTVNLCSDMGCCWSGCLNRKLPTAPSTRARKSCRFANIRRRGVYIMHHILYGEGSADQTLKDITYLIRLARRAP